VDRNAVTQRDNINVVETIQNKRLMKQFIRQLDKEQLIGLFLKQLQSPSELRIPLSIFNKRLSSLEVIVKYLKEDKQYSNNKIALLLGRSSQNIWITYNNSKKKHVQRLKIRVSRNDIPISIFENKQLSILESIVVNLKQSYSDKEIADILKRDKKTIATINHRVKKKIFK